MLIKSSCIVNEPMTSMKKADDYYWQTLLTLNEIIKKKDKEFSIEKGLV